MTHCARCGCPLPTPEQVIVDTAVAVRSLGKKAELVSTDEDVRNAFRAAYLSTASVPLLAFANDNCAACFREAA